MTARIESTGQREKNYWKRAVSRARKILGAQEATLVFDEFDGSGEPPTVSVVLPVHNQQDQIAANIRALADAMVLPYELIVVDDASTDGTLAVVTAIVSDLDQPIRKRVYHHSKPIFETGCDQFGFELADGRFLLEVQADMQITQFGFDRVMVDAVDSFPDLLMVSGRGTEPLYPIAQSYVSGLGSVAAGGDSLFKHVVSRSAGRVKSLRSLALRRRGSDAYHGEISNTNGEKGDLLLEILPTPETFSITGQAGRVGSLIEHVLPPNLLPMRAVWVGETVMRGPLLIHRERYELLGGLDAKRFFLGFDDHDLAVRALWGEGLRCGFVPVGFKSPLDSGTTRRHRSLRAECQIFVQLLRIRKHRNSSGLYDVGRNSEIVARIKNEVRFF
jgi:glycosyltransferase involved in cell wall biosynthesis